MQHDLLKILNKAKEEWGDAVIPLGKPGKRGTDALYVVMDAGERISPPIPFESKNTAGWRRNWFAQANRYRAQYKAPFIVVVTDATPDEATAADHRKHDIHVVKPQEVKLLLPALRRAVLEIARGTDAGQGSTAKRVLAFLRQRRISTGA